ncbi:MAG: M28 family peptidase [Candidatus Aminicenantes bacterium]|nr:M28 family peptidase [Candidatus Aminicenantes bacterium]
MDTELQPCSFNLPELELKINVDMEQKISACGNVLGLIEGSDPELRKEYVVIGAHHDHIGMTEDGYVFNGADEPRRFRWEK